MWPITFFDGNFSSFTWFWILFVMVKVKFNSSRIFMRKKRCWIINNEPNKHFTFFTCKFSDSVSTNSMIDHEHCYVCNRHTYDSEEYDFIVRLKDRFTLKFKKWKDIRKNNLDRFFLVTKLILSL
jgi:DNA sulfur modification protein DndD